VAQSGAALSPDARAAWLTADALIVFVSHYVFVVSSCVLSVLLSAQRLARATAGADVRQLPARVVDWPRGHGRSLARATSPVGATGRDQARAAGRAQGREDLRLAAMARFEREAQATAMRRSPHTVELYDFGVSDTGTFYYVMELREGMDAAALGERFGPLPAKRVIHLVGQVCDSLGERRTQRGWCTGTSSRRISRVSGTVAWSIS
jgi:serine/threonine protein kinase